MKPMELPPGNYAIGADVDFSGTGDEEGAVDEVDESNNSALVGSVEVKSPTDGVIRLSWASELLFMPTEPGQDPRHVGTVEPMWTLLDLTPGGRPDANEQIEYECCRTEAPANTQQA